MNPSPAALVIMGREERDDFLPEPVFKQLEQLLPGLHWVEMPLKEGMTWKDLLFSLKPEILVTAWWVPPLPLDLIQVKPPFLKYLCQVTGSVRRILPREILEKTGLLVTNWGNSVSRTIAEHALLLTLTALRRTTYYTFTIHKDGGWGGTDRHPCRSLFGRRVGIHGFGAIAQKLVPLLRPFDVSIQTYSPRVPDSILAEMKVQRCKTLEELFSTSEVLVELASLTPENRHMVTEKLLRSLPEYSVFVNVGRGAVVDDVALVQIAKEGKLQIALDVLEKEPLAADSPLRGLPNVTLTPHIGGPTKDRRRDCGAHAVENIRRYLKGQPLESVVDLKVYDRST